MATVVARVWFQTAAAFFHFSMVAVAKCAIKTSHPQEMFEFQKAAAGS